VSGWRGPNPWLVLIIGAIVGLPIAWFIFTTVVGLVIGLGS
jgi:hypothetical protein